MENIYNSLGIIDKVEEEVQLSTQSKEQAIIYSSEKGSFDAIIVGGGPAGITAGIYLSRKMINTLIITPELGGQVSWTSNVENYPGYNVISGYELADHFKEQLMRNHINIRLNDSVVSLEMNGKVGIVRTESGAEYSFKSIIVATGKRSRLLDVPGEKKFYGRGVTYCSTCDGPLYRGETVAVIGGGNSGLTAANDLLAQRCKVHLVDILPQFRADAVLIEKAKAHENITFYLNHDVEEITGELTVSGINLRNLETQESVHVDVTGVFIEIGLIPNSGFTEGLLAMNDRKEILVDCRCMTNVPGVYAAGDVTNVPNKQIIVSAGEGAKAALGVTDYLLQK